MSQNSYVQLLQIMRNAAPNPTALQLATVLSTNPFTFKVGELQLSKEDVLIAEHLIDHNRNIFINTTATGNVTTATGAGTLQNINISNQKATFHTTLKARDTVVCYSIANGQQYLILEKVV